jgi:hypothetical protein
MQRSHRITIGVVADGDSSGNSSQGLTSITDRVELRQGFSAAARPFHDALGIRCLDQRCRSVSDCRRK